MGVYIKGMTLDEFSEYGDCCQTLIGTGQAEEIPPHGRLVDAGRLLSEHMKQKYYRLPNGDTAIPIIDIEHAPTVIEKEEVYSQYTDTAGNFHWCGTHSGEHKIKAEEGE